MFIFHLCFLAINLLEVISTSHKSLDRSVWHHQIWNEAIWLELQTFCTQFHQTLFSWRVVCCKTNVYLVILCDPLKTWLVFSNYFSHLQEYKKNPYGLWKSDKQSWNYKNRQQREKAICTVAILVKDAWITHEEGNKLCTWLSQNGATSKVKPTSNHIFNP